MMRIQKPARRGTVSAALAALMLAQVVAAGVLLRASEHGVWFLGHPLAGVCLFRQWTGLPCPTCGMTRSIVLTLNGQLGAALRLNLAGPVWVLAVVTVGLALLWLAWRESAAARRRVRLLALAQGAVFGVMLATNWICALAGRG
jgi:Protein of unknown function (DUF2752)